MPKHVDFIFLQFDITSRGSRRESRNVESRLTSDAVLSLKKGSISYTAANTCKLAEHWEFVRYQMGCELTNQLCVHVIWWLAKPCKELMSDMYVVSTGL